MVGAMPTDQITVGVVVVAVRAIPSGVDILVDVAVLLRPLEQLDRRSRVTRLGRPRPGIDADVQRIPCLRELLVHQIGPRLRRDVVLLRRPHDMLAVLIQPHAERGVVAQQPVIPGHHIGRHLLERMPDVRLPIRIVDRGRDVKRSLAQLASLFRVIGLRQTNGAASRRDHSSPPARSMA